MYNLLISLGIATLSFGLGQLVVGNWVAGFAPATLAFVIAWFILARRTSKHVQALFERVAEALRRQRIDDARRILDSGRRLGRWQFLVGKQIDAQLGALAYLQRDFKTARSHLSRSFGRDWSAQSMLAALDFREGKLDASLERLERVSGAAKKEAVFWGLYAYILLESGARDKALEVLARGLKVLPKSEALKTMRNAVSNNRKVKMKMFGQSWYTFFPEQMPMRRMQPQLQGRSFPQPRR